ncbi:para-aminobenzoate N-oxygenase AurF [Herbihabitans rhizosphaerae]|uniref:Para-aminobenzoate N-oxygenase AurF n=1 Tax=Herbihabitans rhizosphaerae TaxID=1872711 RepID=A0A4Q7KX23_9PSEU|nr:diiron oxygenase [Herbihabitans rhizosphaerae]RZS41247.1 para-aminobenzoate N-oxygenase AurF [Herbihabitans rhizosphaerae]
MGGPDLEYKSRFLDWDRRSWVRSKPRRDSPFSPARHYFSPELCPLLRHPLLADAPAGVRETVLVHALYIHLEFTVRLEMGPVNETCALLRSPRFLPWLPAGMKDDALRIYTDEAAHAEMTHRLLAAVRDETGIVPTDHSPRFLGELSRLYSAELPVYRPLVKLFFTIVSETLITGSLTKLPKDPSVQQSVRDLAQDHAADEGRHHAYFKQLFEYLWPRLPVPLRRKIGMLLPDVVLAFLWLDEPAFTAALEPILGGAAGMVVAETADAEDTRAEVLDSAAPTLRMLRAAGVFDDPVVANAFQGKGFPVEGAPAPPPGVAHDLVLALLAVPLGVSLGDDTAPGVPAHQRVAHLVRWLDTARELDPGLRFTVRDRDDDAGVLSVELDGPVAARVAFCVTDRPRLTTFTALRGHDVAVVCGDRPAARAELETGGTRTLDLDPSWLAALTNPGARPLFWGVSATEIAPSVLDQE